MESPKERGDALPPVLDVNQDDEKKELACYCHVFYSVNLPEWLVCVMPNVGPTRGGDIDCLKDEKRWSR